MELQIAPVQRNVYVCHASEEKMKKIVFTGRRLFMKFGNLDYFEKRAAENNLRVVAVESEDNDKLRDAVRDAAVLVDIARPIGADVIDAMEQCQLILTLSVGYDCVDVECATRHGIPVCNTPAYCTDDVANHAMTLMLALSRKLEIIIPRTRAADWEYKYTKPIFNYQDKVFGIIGLGKIGRAIVPKARGFGMNIMAYDPYVDDDIFRLLDVQRAYELYDLLKQADYVTIHAPLTPETRGMIDEEALGVMKKHAVIVNTARGHIIDEQALLHALKGGSIAGAGLDVLQQEPPAKDEPLLLLDNVIVTPHLAWYSEESFVRDMEQGMDELIRVVAGHRPRYIVNPEIFAMK
jgi:D-3-phosphoglycerate dehydrogenase